MKTTRLIYILVALLISAAAVGITHGQDATPVPDPHWTYEGAEGPEFWGSLPGGKYALCSTGHAQSPIDIADAQSVNLTNVVFHYQDSALNIFNNGHTIQVNYDAGSSITYNEIDYQLLQFHFHRHSEHTIAGKVYDMELHLVHQDANGHYAVVGVLLEVGEADNPAFQAIFDNLPAVKGDPQPTTLRVDAAALLPPNADFYTYNGSLTTPPCTQDVRWLVLTTPVKISAHQVELFTKLFEDNARPVQALNSRDLLQDETP